MRRAIAWGFCFALVALTGCGSSNVELQILDYPALEKLLTSQAGKVVVMDAWSTSCEPCIKEFPHLVALHGKYAKSAPGQLSCISLSLDYDGSGAIEKRREKVLKFLQEQKADFTNVLSSLEADELLKKLDLAAPPAVFVYDRQGKLRKRFDNETPGQKFTYADVEKLVGELLAETKS